jgi:hypothetical protein
VKLSGRNEILEMFSKSVGSAVWTYIEIPKEKRCELVTRFKF